MIPKPIDLDKEYYMHHTGGSIFCYGDFSRSVHLLKRDVISLISIIIRMINTTVPISHDIRISYIIDR